MSRTTRRGRVCRRRQARSVGSPRCLSWARRVRCGSTYLLAVATVGMSDRAATYWAGRATLCSGPEDIERYDQVFTGWFGGEERGLTSVPPERTRPQVWLDSDEGAAGRPTGDPDDEVLKVAASAVEVLRHRDVTTLTAAEKQLLAATIDTLRPRAPLRRGTRRLPSRVPPDQSGTACPASCSARSGSR